jgi:hypothetical protein
MAYATSASFSTPPPHVWHRSSDSLGTIPPTRRAGVGIEASQDRPQSHRTGKPKAPSGIGMMLHDCRAGDLYHSSAPGSEMMSPAS